MAKPIAMSLKSLAAAVGDETTVIVYSDKQWTYPLDLPSDHRNQKECPMLDVMFSIEKRAGTLVYIPQVIVGEPVQAPIPEPSAVETAKPAPAKKPAAKKQGKVK